MIKLFKIASLSLLSLFFQSTSSFAQLESNNWYFGNGAGLSFSSGQAVPLKNGNLYTNEGCASISDNNGKLLFYTDGVTVWDKDHSPMSNGSGLHGGASSTQSALIVPKPGSSTEYYLFTVGESAGKNGLSYSIVDFATKEEHSSDKFTNYQHLIAPDLKIKMGKGKIKLKNQLLMTPAAEKLTAVKNYNGTDFWIISHKWNSNEFYVYPLTNKGVGEAVISKVGLFHGSTGATNNGESIGYLKPSSNGRKLASAICYRLKNNIEIFDFDNNSGKLSNPVRIPSEGYAYGLSFSPDNSKLYVSFLKGPTGIMQYDLPEAGEINTEQIAKSGNRICPNDEDYSFGALQIGPDGKIYIARVGPYLDVIHEPNNSGTACKYEARSINLGARNSTYGLPNIINSSFQIEIGNDTVICSGPFTIKAPEYENATYLWSNGSTSSEISIGVSGNYRVQIFNPKTQRLEVGSMRVSIQDPPVVDLGNDTSFCKQEMVLNAKNRGYSYRWSTGENTQQIKVNKSGTYSVEVYKGGCIASDEITLVLAGKTTVFTPLHDSVAHKGYLSTTFYYSVTDVYDYYLQIYKGKKLKYETRDVTNNWNARTRKGKEITKGEYIWKVTYKSKCMDNQEYTKEGTLTLIDAKSEMQPKSGSSRR